MPKPDHKRLHVSSGGANEPLKQNFERFTQTLDSLGWAAGKDLNDLYLELQVA